MRGKSGLLYGVAINDASYQTRVTAVDAGKIIVSWRCPYYARWVGMLARCFSKPHQKSSPAYVGCSVSDEWLVFSNFKAWMEQQDWEGKELDKDIICTGNKIYSKDSCCFIDKSLNIFISDSRAHSNHLTGVSPRSCGAVFDARCKNPFTKKTENLGCYPVERLAHEAWKARKHEIACQLAELQPDQRVANALRVRYLNQDWPK